MVSGKLVSELPAQLSTASNALQGFFYLQRGDYLFCRDISNPQEENDVLQLWIPAK